MPGGESLKSPTPPRNSFQWGRRRPAETKFNQLLARRTEQLRVENI
jgi:hypothetical protein